MILFTYFLFLIYPENGICEMCALNLRRKPTELEFRWVSGFVSCRLEEKAGEISQSAQPRALLLSSVQGLL
jgi:hypothetical protein